MKFLKILLGIIIVVIVIFFVAGIFLPKTYSVSRSTEINAPDSVVYHKVADFNSFKEWNPWYKMEPSAKIVISGTPEQVGSSYTWDGKKTGQGKMEIKEVKPFSLVTWDLNFIKPFEGYCLTKVTMEPSAAGTTVTWSIEGENHTTLEKWMGLTMDQMMGKDFESGLKNLKDISEKK